MIKIRLHFWYRISPRERLLLVGCAAVIFFWLIYTLLWQPVQQQREQWQRDIKRDQQTVAWMLSQAPLLHQLPAHPTAGETGDVSARIMRSAAMQGLVVTRLQPQGKQLAVTLEASDFNKLIAWFTQLESENQIRVMAFEVAEQPQTPGWVTVNRLLLESNDAQ